MLRLICHPGARIRYNINMEMIMYLKNKIKVSTSQFSYTILSFLAEVGGYIGLLLGVSLLDIPALIDRIFALSKNQKQ